MINPPLNSIRCFTKVAHFLSFTKAAQELFVTQGAVSKQIKSLEKFLGVKLFERTTNGIVLTKHGQEYFNKIQEPIKIIDQSTASILRKKNHDIIKINALPSISSNWLIRAISSFNNIYPTVKFNIVTGDGAWSDFNDLNCDIAIKSSDKPFLDIANVPIIQERMILVANPNVVDISNFSLSEISNYTLLEHRSRASICNNWILENNIKYDPNNRLIFEHFYILINAIQKGLGIGFIPDFLNLDDFDQGKLVNINNISFKTNITYYLIYKECSNISKPMSKFISWVKENA